MARICSRLTLRRSDSSSSRTRHFYYDPQNKESLSDAIINGHAGSLRRLLSAGASPNEQSRYEPHPLILAMGKEIDIVKLLIEAGANFDATDSRGNTGLHLAICSRNDSTKKLKLLLSAGASPNAVNADGETPLLCAVKYGDVESLQELINAGAKFDPVNSQPDIRLHMALLQKDWDTVQSLLKAGVATDYVNDSGDTPLTLAIASGKVEIVQQLIDAGADVNYMNEKRSCDSQLISPLHDAIRLCEMEIVKLLLKHGADPNGANTRRYYSALSIATRIKRNRMPILNLLLDYGADMYINGFCLGADYDEINELPFESMVETNDLEGVRLFLQRGFDLDKYQTGEPEHYPSSPLHSAMWIKSDNFHDDSRIRDSRMLLLLLDHYRAKGTLSTEFQRGLREGNSPLFRAANHFGDYQNMDLILEAGADPNCEDGNGRTVLDHILFTLSTCYNHKGIRLLIEFGAHLRNSIQRLLDEVNVEEERDSLSDEDSEGSFWGYDDWDSDFAHREFFNVEQRRRFSRENSTKAQRAMKKAMCIIRYRVLYEIQHNVDDPVYPMIKDCDILKRYYGACQRDIDFLRKKQFKNSVTYYDMFIDKNFWRRPIPPDALKEALSQFSYDGCRSLSAQVRVYMDDLKEHWESGYENYKLLKPAMKGLALLLGFNEGSYHLILSYILNCLHIEDWCNLCKSVGITIRRGADNYCYWNPDVCLSP